MLTAHQRLAIRARLPEVIDVVVIDELHHNLASMATVRLKLEDGSEITVYGEHQNKAVRHRLRSDYSDRVDVLPIPAEMRARLETVFGPLKYRDDPC